MLCCNWHSRRGIILRKAPIHVPGGLSVYTARRHPGGERKTAVTDQIEEDTGQYRLIRPVLYRGLHFFQNGLMQLPQLVDVGENLHHVHAFEELL